MKLLHKMINKYIDRMSQEEKEQLLEGVIAKFLDELSPQDKQRLIERMLPKLFEGVDKKELMTNIMAMLVQGSTKEINRAKVMEAMSKIANGTGDKITGMIPTRVKNILKKSKEAQDAPGISNDVTPDVSE